MRTNRTKYFYSFLIIGFIFVGATIPIDKVIAVVEKNSLFSILLSQEALHGCGFALLAWILCLDFAQAGKKSPPYRLIALLVIIYGVMIELWHLLLPYRSFALYDIGIDIIGCLTGLVIFYLLRGAKQKIA